MKTFTKYAFLLPLACLLVGCSAAKSSESISSSNSDSSSNITSRDPGVSAEEYKTKANAINKVDYKTAKITFTIREKVTGTYPVTQADGTAMPADVEVTSSLVIEDNGSGFFQVVSGAVSSEINNIKGGANLYITGWLTWMEQLKKNSEAQNSNVTFEARYYLNPLGAWYKNTGTRPGLANATYEGEYLGSEEYFMHYGENGYATSFSYNRNVSNVGTITKLGSEKIEYNGKYFGSAEATVEYTF